MDVMDEIDDELLALLRHTLDLKAAALPIDTSGPVLSRSPRQSRRPHRRRWLAAAACVIAAAGATGVVAYRASAPDDSPQAVAEPPPETPAPAGSDDPADYVQWFLPAALPVGYELVDVSATVATVGDADMEGPATSNTTWERRDDAGIVVATIDASATLIGDGLPPLTGSNGSVHGLPALVSNTGESGYAVVWQEAGNSASVVSSDGLSLDEVVAIAEASAVTPGAVTLDPTSLPDGYQPGDTSSIAGGTVFESVMLNIDSTLPGGSGIFVDIGSAARFDPDREDVTEVRTVGGVDYYVDDGDEGRRFVMVTWVLGDHLLRASGNADVDTLLAVAAAIQPVTVQEARAGAAVIESRITALPELATATFSDGFTATAYGARDGSTGVVALCVGQSDERCIRRMSFGPAEAELEVVEMFEIFALDGGRRMIGWSSDEPATSTTDGTTVEVVAAGEGWFASVPADGPISPEIPLAEFAPLPVGSKEGVLVASEAIRP